MWTSDLLHSFVTLYTRITYSIIVILWVIPFVLMLRILQNCYFPLLYNSFSVSTFVLLDVLLKSFISSFLLSKSENSVLLTTNELVTCFHFWSVAMMIQARHFELFIEISAIKYIPAYYHLLCYIIEQIYLKNSL